MAYTFEELADWWPSTHFPVCPVTLLLTQEDGRSCYGSGYINTFYDNGLAGQVDQQFSDRTRQLAYGPPSDRTAVYVQNFDMNTGIDPANFVFKKIATNQFELQLTLLRWGNALVNVPLAEASNAKLYTGWGSTIGAGTGRALYVISINDAWDTPG